MESPLATLSALEEQIVAAVVEHRDELIGLVGDLVALDTTARNPGEPARDEAALQGLLQARLLALGAETDLWEPEPTGRGNPFVPDEQDYVGRPQLAARLRGVGGGRNLLLNGHIDAVSAEPREQWSSDPFTAEIRDGRLYGRGACDMKGGIADMLFALETLQRLGVRLAGDVVWCTDTDEEQSGAGAIACAEHGVRADAGLCAEPTGFDVWVACRGCVNPTLTIEGRPGHAECVQPDWRAGGAVNAIEKLRIVLEAVRDIRADWRSDPARRHPYVGPPDLVPTVVRGGEWMVTYPASCSLTFDVQYLPGQVDANGSGRAVFREVEERVAAAASLDPWLREHPLRWEWPWDIVPAEVSDDHPLVATTLAAGAALGRTGRIGGLDSWHDAAVFTLRAGTPTVSFGPGSIAQAHIIDEYVPVQDLIDHAAAVALVLTRWCGVVG
jgi:acetylornithine deacetylase